MTSPDFSIPSVSIVVPMYNAASTIVRALESIRSQTYRDWHCHVVNDASTDNSLSVAAAWLSACNDSRFTLHSFKDNRGLANVRNYIMLRSESPWLAMLDSDDAWLPEYLQLRWDYTQQHPQVDALYGGMIIASGTGRVPDKNDRSRDLDVISETCQGPTLFIRRRVFQNSKGYRTMYAEDGDLFERLVESGSLLHKVQQFDTYLYYQGGPNSITEIERRKRTV
jgi:glycosyltransferase involved in cell wall biosynthesis